MNTNVNDLRDTIIPKSDQLNADQLLGGSMTITVTSVSRGTTDQPVVINYMDDNGRPYKPGKSMRKVLIFAWGENGGDWIGRSMTLFNKQDVKFGGVAVGGIRISHMSHIERDIALSLTATKGKKEPFTVKRLVQQADPNDAIRAQLKSIASQEGLEAFRAEWNALTKPQRQQIGAAFRDDCAGIAQALDDRRAPAAEPEPAANDEPAAVAADEGEVF